MEFKDFAEDLYHKWLMDPGLLKGLTEHFKLNVFQNLITLLRIINHPCMCHATILESGRYIRNVLR